MPNFKYPKFLLVIPAVLAVFLIYPIGVNTFLASRDYRSLEIDSPGPAMQLQDISNGFSRDNPRRPFPLFHSIVMSSAYVPYIWARTSVLPPYDLNVLDNCFPSLKGELIIISRCMNLIAAIGIVIISFYLMWLFCNSLLPPFLVSLMVAFNVDLMFQSSAIYYESWSVFWVMLSVLFFIKSILEKTKTLFWFSGFIVILALAVSCHERMVGYYIFTAPFLLYAFYAANRRDKRSTRWAVFLTFVGLGFGFIAFCLVNNVFFDGFWPILEYIRFKTMGVNSSPERLHSLLGFLNNQFRCHRHALWLIIWNLGGIVPIFSLCGIWSIWKKRFTPAIAMLLFPLGYQILGIGLPGWTSGRYIMGQTIFVTIYAGFGIAWCIEYAKKTNKMIWFWALMVFALVSQLFFIAVVKIADNYYHPYRIIEKIISDPANKTKKIVIQGIDFPLGLFSENNVMYEVFPGERKLCPEYDIIISKGLDGSCSRNLYNGTVAKLHKLAKSSDGSRREDSLENAKNGISQQSHNKEVRNPPGWILFLISDRLCYLYIQLYPLTIEWRNNVH